MGCTQSLACPELIKAHVDIASCGVVLDTRTHDTWSLGCMFFEVFTSCVPFVLCEPSGSLLADMARQHDEWVSVIMLLVSADPRALQ